MVNDRGLVVLFVNLPMDVRFYFIVYRLFRDVFGGWVRLRFTWVLTLIRCCICGGVLPKRLWRRRSGAGNKTTRQRGYFKLVRAIRGTTRVCVLAYGVPEIGAVGSDRVRRLTRFFKISCEGSFLGLWGAEYGSFKVTPYFVFHFGRIPL